MRAFAASVLLAASVAIVAPRAEAASPAALDVRGGPMAAALAELARQARIELLFDHRLVQGLTARPVHGRLSSETALSRLLAGSGIGYRTTSDGAFVLFAIPAPRPIDTGDGAVAELLVVGRRTQNADIRRTENDIQPYSISGSRELAVAQHDNIDQYLRARLPANAQRESPEQIPSADGATNSAINLRGIGTQRTLVLIDGRRIPGLPTDAAGIEQADLNALPLGVVERIETLTATAGGIHGPGALGGVVNVVLRRDYRGADLTVVSGISDRGDAGRARLEARIGFTPDKGDTDVMLAASYGKAKPLRAGQRDYVRRALDLQTTNNPATFLNFAIPVNAVLVRSNSGAPLRLDPSFGGATLASAYTYLPFGFVGDDAARAAALIANAGKIPATQPIGGAGRMSSLVSTPEVGSALVNTRRRLSDGLELFVDGIYLYNRGQASSPAFATQGFVSANAPNNPFAQSVLFTFPTPQLASFDQTTIEMRRFTGGVIASLPRSWQGSADVTLGRTDLTRSAHSLRAGFDLDQAIGSGQPGPDGLPAVAPLGDSATLLEAVTAYASEASTVTRLANKFHSVSARAAGPLTALPGGPLTLTLSGELRREHIPQSTRVDRYQDEVSTQDSPERTQAVGSAYVELRAPVLARDTAFALARGLELQLAVRHDQVRTTFPQNTLAKSTFDLGQTTIRHDANVFTAGARVFPAPWLMLRGSAATGESPPNLQHLQERVIRVSFDNPAEPVDAKRGGRRITEDGDYLWIRDGYHDLAQEKALTVSAGFVINPSDEGGPRLSVDYSRVDVRDEIVPIGFTNQELLDAEDRLPGRVVREPLSAADAALGYTAGRVTRLYVGLINAGRTITQAVDVELDWTLPSTAYGQGRVYGSVTWQPTFRSRVKPEGPLIERAGYWDGPLKWRGNAGLMWTQGPLTLDFNAQYYDGHRVASSDADFVRIGPQRIRFQGSDRIPSRVYVDLAARRAFELAPGGRVRAIDVRVGVQNLFDRSPPIAADPNLLGYDTTGDPRRRRVELLVSAAF